MIAPPNAQYDHQGAFRKAAVLWHLLPGLVIKEASSSGALVCVVVMALAYYVLNPRLRGMYDGS